MVVAPGAMVSVPRWEPLQPWLVFSPGAEGAELGVLVRQGSSIPQVEFVSRSAVGVRYLTEVNSRVDSDDDATCPSRDLAVASRCRSVRHSRSPG